MTARSLQWGISTRAPSYRWACLTFCLYPQVGMGVTNFWFLKYLVLCTQTPLVMMLDITQNRSWRKWISVRLTPCGPSSWDIQYFKQILMWCILRIHSLTSIAQNATLRPYRIKYLVIWTLDLYIFDPAMWRGMYIVPCMNELYDHRCQRTNEIWIRLRKKKTWLAEFWAPHSSYAGGNIITNQGVTSSPVQDHVPAVLLYITILL